VSFSDKEQELVAIATQHQRLTKSVFHYFDGGAGAEWPEDLALENLDQARNDCLEELDHSSSMTALAALEAAIRVDYLARVYDRRKDPLSRAMRALHGEKANNARLEDELLEIWKREGSVASLVISEVRAAFRYRHWLAHGRYWLLKTGRTYDFTTVYEVSDAMLSQMDQYSPENS
jgi:hypothetical protein